MEQIQYCYLSRQGGVKSACLGMKEATSSQHDESTLKKPLKLVCLAIVSLRSNESTDLGMKEALPNMLSQPQKAFETGVFGNTAAWN